MKKVVLLFVFALAVFASQANAANYELNEQAVDQLFDNAIENVSIETTNSSATMLTSADDVDPIVALVLGFFLGGFGAHRFYMGTETMSALLYPITCGGIAGIIPLVDIIVMAINYEDMSKFYDNPKFIMWKDEL